MEALQAKVTIAWLDWGDPQQLRPKDMQKLLQVYADGQLLSSDSYTITEEGPADFYGMEAYSYLISGLPVYAQAEAAESEEVTEGEEATEEAEAGTPISYVVKQDTSLLTAYQNLDPLMLAVLLNPDAESEEELVVTEEQAAAFLAMDGEWAVTPEDGSAPARAFVNFFADGVVLAETKKETDWETDASVQTQVVWFDAINDKAYTHDGELLPSISYTVDGEQYDLSLTWDAQAIDNGDGTFRAAYSYTYTQEDADRLGVTAGEKLVITDTGDNNLNRTLAAANLTSKRIDRTLTQGTNSETGEPEWTVTEEKTTDITWSPISIGFWNGTENGPDNSKYPTPNVSRYSRKEEKNPDGSVSYTMYPMQNLVIDIEFRAGIENAKDHPGWAKTLFEQTGISMNGKDVNGDPGFNFDENLTDFWDQLLETYGARRSDFTLTGPDSDGRYHYTILNVPVYDTDKKQITYTLDTKEETLNVNASGDWYFTIENDNKNVPGYGTDVSQGYNGGTVILTRTNTTEYRATKIWQDELTKEERQSTDWTLWRYAARQGDTFEMAAQVFMDADNKTITIVATDKNGDVTKTFVNTFNWTTSGETIEHFLIENLPKYNSDGYEYTYFAREANLDSSYVRHFGAYTDGEFQEESAEETANREKTGYRGINNGGAVANQKTQYIPISVTKEWVAARYQNDLSNIQVVVKLKAKHVHSQGDDAKDSWHDVLDGNGNPRTLTLEGFTAYQLTQTRTMEVDQYCSEGHELEFMWEEVAIYELETDEAGNLLKDEDGNYNVKKEIYKEKKVIDGEEQDIFCLSINSKAVETDSFPHADEYFVSNSNSNDQLGDGQVITNTLEGTTEYFVKKTWDETLTAGPITISLKAYDSAGRDVTQELTDKGYALEKTLKEDTPLTIKDENNKDTAYGGNYESRDSQWVHLFEDLPKYDAEGNLYNYIIREYGTTINGTMPEYHYGNDVDDDTVDEKQSVLIHNAPVPGVVQYIDVRKVWLDDSVTAGRDDCKFAIYAGTYPNGRLLYGKNDDDSNGLLGDYVIVAEGSNWWRHVDVTVFAYCVNVSGTIQYLTYGQLQQNWETLTEYDEKGQQVNNQDTDMLTWARNHLVKDFYVVEAAIGDNQVGTASDTRPSSQGYPVTLGGDGVTCYATIYNRSSGGNKECTDQRDVRGYYTVLNRRIGALKYAITKKWVDGSQDADYRQSWKATLKLSCVESPEAVQDMTSKETEEISGYVRMPIAPEKEEAGSGESSAIMDILANEEYGWRSILDDAGNPVRTEQQLGNTAVDSNTERVVYTNLPMYDYLGRLIHYEITETMKGKTDPVKVSKTASTEKLNGVTLVFQSSDNQWTLTWERNADGEERYEIKKGQGSWSASGEKENGGFVTGPVQITGLPVGKTFILKSETPPKGYVMPKGTVSFKLKADGTLSIVSGANTYLTLGTDNLALTLADPETQITLKKLNQENTEITEGYTFKLHGIFHTENGDKEEDRTLAPDSKVKDGELMVSTNASSPEYTYTLTETRAPDGYKLSNVTVKFYLDVNGTVHILEGQSVATANGSTVSFKDDPFTLTVRKQEENANRFPAGAEFELKEHETNKVLGKFTTGKNGSVTINSTATNPKLKVDGIYVLTETKAPDGYLLPEENARSKTFQIQDDGTALTGTIDASGSFTPGTDPETAMLTFTDKPIKITLKKINVETNEGLSGARFRLDRKTSDNPEKWTTVRSGVTTGKDGTVLLWDAANGPYVVQGGTYRLVETQAPAGYVTEGTTEFTVSGDGKTVTVTGEAPSDTITITNRKTSFKIMKRDNELEKPLSGATLAIYEYDASDDTHKGKRIATWETDGMGHTLDGVPEGEYILCEEVTPEGFAQIPSLHFKLREGNQIQLIGASTTHFALGEPEQGSDVYTIYAIDKKVRGHVALTKVRASDQAPLKGVMFDLYQVVPDGEDLRIARNLETNEHGEWTSVGSERLFEESVDAGKKLSTGLPKGDYYFLEVAATEDTALDRQTKHSFTITTDGEVAHPDKTGTIVNQMFTANVKLKKLDEVSGANVSGATFTLTYAADSAVYSQEAVTNSSGEVTFQDLPKKGTYILEETMAPNGYDIAGVHGEDHKPFKAELILDDDDYKQTVVINRARVDAKKLTVLQGSITADGIPNPRLLGSVTLYKADGDEVSKALDGAEFTLYKKNEATNLWDRLKSFLTGGTYTVEGVLDGTALHEAGKLTITDLDWGTYRLVETKGADGYAAVDENGDPIEVEFTIDRDSNKNIALTSDGHSFYNYHTILVIQKQGTNGAALTGAEFKLEGTFVDETGKTVTGTKTLATDSKGQIVLEGVLIAGETYTLTETKAPSGYSLRTGSFRFRMEADGSTTVVRSASGYQLSKSEFFDNQIVVTDRRKSTTFKTGDSSDLTLWLSLTAASLTGLVTVLALSRKKKRNTKA